MKRTLKATATILAALALLVVALAATPIGWSMAARVLERSVERSTGLDLEVGGLRGNLLSNVSLTEVSLSVPGGPVILSVESAAARYELSSLIARRVEVPRVRLDGVSVLIEAGPDGNVVGWSEMTAGSDAPRSERPLEYDLSFVLEGSSVTLRDTARGISLSTTDLAASGSVSRDAFEIALCGSLTVAAPGLDEPAAASFAGDVARDGDLLSVDSLRASSRGLSLLASGRMALEAGRVDALGAGSSGPAVLRLDVLSRLELDEISDLVGGGGSGEGGAYGTVHVEAALSGPLDSLSYSARATAGEAGFGGIGLTDVEVEVEGDQRVLDVTGFRAGLLGGRAAGLGHLDLAAAGGDSAALPFRLEVNVDGLDLAEVARSYAPGEGLRDTRGVLTASVEASGTSPRPGDVSAAMEAHLVGLSVGAVELGDASFEGSFAGGRLVFDGDCCSTGFGGTGSVGAEGLSAAAFWLDFRDLSAVGAAFGLPELAGTGAAGGTLTGVPAEPLVSLEAQFPDISYDGIALGPAAVQLEHAGDGLEGTLTARGGAIAGRGSLDPAGGFAASIRANDLDLAAAFPDSIRETMALSGSVSAGVDVAGDAAGVTLVEGVVSALSLGARGHDASLDAPFGFRATPDSMSVDWISLTSDVGGVSLAGGIGASDSGHLSARFRDLDLSAAADLAPEGSLVPVEGTLNGSVELSGSLRRPRFSAGVSVEGLSVAGLAFDSATLDAEGDTADIVFDASVTSGTSGSAVAYGNVPVRMDSAALWALDRGREFGASIVCEALKVDAGGFLLPSVAGEKTLSANGSILLGGRADSLGSLTGRGRFDELSATFDLVRFASADTVEFEIGGGAVEFDDVWIDVTRRRVIGDESGGVIRLAGEVRGDGTVDFSSSAQGMEIGRILRTFAPGSRAEVSGELDAEVRVTGSTSEPAVGFSCRMEEPSISVFAFSEAVASGRVEKGRLSLESAELSAGESTVRMSGTLPLRAPGRSGETATGPGAEEMDLRIAAEGFDLGSIRPRRAEIERLSGVLDADVRITGQIESPRFEGTMGLRNGKLKGLGLAEPLRDVVVDISAGDGVVALNRASAGMGGGTVEAAGFVAIVPEEEPTFLLRAKLESPEIAVEGSFDAALGGAVLWAGSAGRSRLSGAVTVERARMTRDVGVLDALRRRPVRVVVSRRRDPLANVELDLAVDLEEPIEVRNNVAEMNLNGGFHLGGTLYAAEVSGGLYAEGGSFHYLENEFELEALSLAFIDPRRRDPYVDLLGTASVDDRSGESYTVTLRFQGFAYDAVPELTSSPPLSEPDIVALLTFGDTVGWLVTGGDRSGSSGDRFIGLARRAFVSSAFGVAESTLERLLHLDTVAVDDDALLAGDIAGADVTLGKEFGDRVRVNYTTAVGRFSDQRVEVSLRLTRRFSIETRADPEGNHAIDLRLRLPFR